jgi:hypothetical protein
MRPPDLSPLSSRVTRTGHELVSFAVFLDYRARRMRAPVAGLQVTTPTPTDPPAPDGGVAMVVPIAPDE